jgi:adenine-specific DNA methylase
MTPRRLIEADLPIKRISSSASQEKDGRRGHVPLMYIWPATKPTASCRAVVLASILPDPADPACPDSFRRGAIGLMQEWAATHAFRVSQDSHERLKSIKADTGRDPGNVELRQLLIDFVADYSSPRALDDPAYVTLARSLTKIATAAMPGAARETHVVLDSFAGGGAIPLEASRLALDVVAGELNPVAVLYEKVLLSYLPRYGERLVSEFDRVTSSARDATERELASLYPRSEGGAHSIAFLWARTVLSEEPTQEPPVEIPLMTTLWLARGKDPRALRWITDATGRVACEIVTSKMADGRELTVRRPLLEIFRPTKPSDVPPATVRSTAAVCPVSAYVTSPGAVRRQLKARRGGGLDARLYTVVDVVPRKKGRIYRLPTQADVDAASRATAELDRILASERVSPIPNEPIPVTTPGLIHPPTFGGSTYADLFTARQSLFLATFVRFVRQGVLAAGHDPAFAEAVLTASALLLNRLADLNSNLCVWQLSTPNAAHVFGRWGLPMIWAFAEVNPLAGAGGSPESAKSRVMAGMRAVVGARMTEAQVLASDARALPLPDDSVDVFYTDPPYYNAVAFADLSDYFYVWMRRVLAGFHRDLLRTELTPKGDELAEMAGWDAVRYGNKDKEFFEREMERALEDARRVLKPGGIGVVVFAHKSASGWEALLNALIGAGWTITASWPIDTEMASRMQAKGAAALASSVHLVCRPRESASGQLATEVGDWRDVLAELGPRIQEWMPRLAQEGIVGADAIFACLGPALEIFSRFSRVEKVSGEQVPLREYLEHVWAAVARSALSLLFVDADASGLEADARLTAMWLWTLHPGSASPTDTSIAPDEEGASRGGGLALDFDTARKIAQGLGADLDAMTNLVRVKGDTAWLLSVRDRAPHLLGTARHADAQSRPGKLRARVGRAQLQLFEIPPVGDVASSEVVLPDPGRTALDRVHQAMLVFGSGQSRLLQDFLEGGVGSDSRFWSLAQALSALYSPSSDEKRWVDGVLARKKSFGY